MKKHAAILVNNILIAAALLVASTCTLRADTSYLLIQGPFGSGSATETFEWQVNYQPGQLTTGQDLLTAVFGQPVSSGSYTDAFSGMYPYSVATSGTLGVGYIYFPSTPTQPFAVSFTVNGSTVTQDPSYSPGWSYLVAGGGGANGSDNLGAPYADGTWSFSNDGASARTLSNDSYNAWVFGSTFSDPTITGSGSVPDVADFAGATVVNVPEPSQVCLLVLGGAGLLAWRRRRRV